MHRPVFFVAGLLLWLATASAAEKIDPTVASPQTPPSAAVQELIGGFCIDCHNSSDVVAGLDLEKLVDAAIAPQREVWEKVVRKLAARQMPPGDHARPTEQRYRQALNALEERLDKLAARSPQPGRTETFRRLTRTEYRNAIRDLLSLDIDVESLLPADEVSHGFDNITVGELSPTLLNRYILAAQKISRLAVGSATGIGGKTFRVPPDVTQEERVEGLPLGTRGGILIPYTFPQDGEYEIQIRLARDRNEHVEGLNEPHQLEVLLDRERVGQFVVKPPRGNSAGDASWEKPTHANVDRHLKQRIRVSAGPHDVGVTFIKNPSSLLETRRQPLNVHYNMYRHPRLTPAIYQVSITGPYDGQQKTETPSREKIFSCWPESESEEVACARQIVATLLRRACRKPVSDDDLQRTMEVYHQARQEGDFESGIEMAVSAVLVNPQFLFRVERQPSDLMPGEPYEIDDLELASRLSFFLWSSIPDEELLALAEAGKLSEPEVLESQTRRMLADTRARALVTNFASQWLYLRNLDSVTPDLRRYPDFDDNLRQAFRTETELFVESILHEDRSVLDLLRADYTFLNERLAKHYGIPHVYGSRFRRVRLGVDSKRGGLLRHGSILTVTSYATRTSPVIRGKWILENLLGTPPPPPPPDIPALEENTVSADLSVRERLAQHRADPTCARCHNLIDPVGFALENFDAVGRWREIERGEPVDASGGLPDGSRFTGVAGLEEGLLARPELFASTVTEKLMTYALGRGLTAADAPAIRTIVRQAAADDYRLSSLIVGIVKSVPFKMRTAE